MDDDKSTEERGGSQEDESSGGEGKTAFEEYKGDKECPECGEPIIEVRASCPNCGYEYKDDDYSDEDAGSEFVAGSAVDDEGNEIPDDETGGGGEQSEDPGLSDADRDKSDGERGDG